MKRRTLLAGGLGITGMGSMAGCLASLGFRRRSARAPPIVENRPDAVYIPSHVEGMQMAGMGSAGPYRAALTVSFPHRFWLMTGRNREMVELRTEDSVHLMVSLWDAETKVVPPTSDVTLAISRDGETVTEKAPWPMLSQNMGFHFGDNYALPGDGTYSVTVNIGPMQTRRTGAFVGRFDEPSSVEFSLEYSLSKLNELSFQTLDDTKGDRGAVEPMQMEMVPLAQLPQPGELPGTIVGEVTSGDGRFVVSVLDEVPSGIEGSGEYLAVSARTPYNRYPLPFMSVAGTLSRDGSAVFDGPLKATLDPDLNYHYGAVVDEIASADTIELEVGAPPQVARHEGYETAFVDMSPMELQIS
jgi:hypothetical protein